MHYYDVEIHCLYRNTQCDKYQFCFNRLINSKVMTVLSKQLFCRCWNTLTNDQKSMRINHSKEIVAALRNDPNFLISIFTSDETWCFQYDSKTEGQCTEWKSKN